jgi:DNA-binding beta-propeller fold protein YncE
MFALEDVLAGQDGPVAVAFDGAGRPIVAEEGGGGEILRLDPGARPTTIAAGGFPLPVGGLAVANGTIAVAASGAILEVPEQGGSRRAVAVGLRGPLTGLATGADGRLYVGVAGTGHVADLPWGGGTPLVAAAGLHTPTGLAVGPSGSLYIVDDTATGDEVLRLAPGASAHVIARLPAGDVAAGIAVAPPGPFRLGADPAQPDLYVAVNGGIDVVDPQSGAVQPFLASVDGDGPRRPAGIAFSPDGRSLYIADLGQTLANVPLPTTGAVWRVAAIDGPAGTAPVAGTPSTPAIQVSPAPGPQNKVRPIAPPRPWYRQPHVVLAGAGALVIVAGLLLLQFRRSRL